MISEFVTAALPTSPMLLAVIGFAPAELGRVSGLAPVLVDLDSVDPGTALEAPASGVVAVLARTRTDLRRAASMAALFPAATRVSVTVADADRSAPLPAAPPGGDLLSVQVRRGPETGWTVDAEFARPQPAGDIVAALIRDRGGSVLQAIAGPRVALAGAGASHWRPGDPGVTLTTLSGPLGDPDDPPPADIVLRTAGPAAPRWADPRVRVVLDRPADLPPSGVDMVPPVDERSVNPAGFVSNPQLGDGVLSRGADRWSVAVDAGTVVRFPPSGQVSDAEVARLRQLRAVTIDWGGDGIDTAAIRVVAGLAAAGVPLRAPAVPPSAAVALGGDLADLIAGVTEDDLVDDLRREEHSVRLRRAALRTHSTAARWRELARAGGLPVPAPPLISVVLCTRRPEFLDFALGQIARQRGVDLELILTLHGVAAARPEVKAAVAGFDRPITVVEAPADVPFGVALNHGAARAAGRYVAKWDDDDWYGADFLADMTLASSYSGADLVGCHAQFVYLGPIDLTIYRRARSEYVSGWISGGTFVMDKSALDAVGGFPPASRHVDAALRQVLTAAGARIYRTHSLGYMLHRRATGHTWQQPVTYFLRAAAAQWRGLRFNAFIEPAWLDSDRTAATG